MSIANKVTLVVSLLAALLLLAAAYGSAVNERTHALERAQRHARLLGELLKATAETAIRDHGHLGKLSDLASSEEPVMVVFYGADGRAIAPVPIEEEPVVDPRARRVIERRLAEETTVGDRRRPTFVYRAPLLRGRTVAAALELRVALGPLTTAPLGPRWLLFVGGILLLFALLVALFSRSAIERPVSRLMAGMDEVIQGDLTATLPLERSDEIGRIAYRFNEMTAQLRRAQDQVHAAAEARLKLEQSLRHSEKLATVGQLSAEFAHEVGTPLNVIGGRARVLERKADQPHEVRKNARIIADQADRITKIIQQMLDLARARVPQRAAVALPRIIDDAIAFLEYQIERGQIEVEAEIASDLPLVHGDADGLQQVVLNLLLNAIQAMPHGGRLLVRCEELRRRKGGLDLAPPQRYLALTIADQGVGIELERPEQIFEPFYSTKDKGQGTGLGLTVVHGIVKEHDGWIEVAPGEPSGTVFRVYLPLEQAEEDPVPETKVDAEPNDESQRLDGEGQAAAQAEGE